MAKPKSGMTAGKDCDGKPTVKVRLPNGMVETTTFIERNPGHPRGKGVSTWVSYGKD